MQCVTWGNLLIWVLQLFKYSFPAMWFKKIKSPWIFHNTGENTFIFVCEYKIQLCYKKNSWVKNKQPSRQMYASIDWAAVLQDKPSMVSMGLSHTFWPHSPLTLPCSFSPFLKCAVPVEAQPCPVVGSWIQLELVVSSWNWLCPAGSSWNQLCLAGTVWNQLCLVGAAPRHALDLCFFIYHTEELSTYRHILTQWKNKKKHICCILNVQNF